MKIALLDGFTLGYEQSQWDEFKKYGDLKIAEFNDSTPIKEVIGFIGDSEIILTNKVKINKEIMDACPNIRMIQVLATGYNIIDVGYAKEKGITVCNIPSYSTMSVAQHTIGLLLEVCLRIGHHDDEVHAGRWHESRAFSFWNYELIELDGKTLGIIGFGTIGKTVAKIAHDLGMRVLAYTPHPKEGFEDIVEFTDLDTVLKESDAITLHCLLSDKTFEIINKDNIAKMKDGVILINTSRGQVLNEADVTEALKSGKISAAAVDVVSEEPPKKNNPLFTAPNCIITPHIAWATKEARQRLMDVCYDNVEKFIDGKTVNAVN